MDSPTSYSERQGVRALDQREAAHSLVRFLTLPAVSIRNLLLKQESSATDAQPPHRPSRRADVLDVHSILLIEPFQREEFTIIPDEISADCPKGRAGPEQADGSSLVLEREYWQSDTGEGYSLAFQSPEKALPESLGLLLDGLRGVSQDSSCRRDRGAVRGIVFLRRARNEEGKSQTLLTIALDVRVPETGYKAESYVIYICPASRRGTSGESSNPDNKGFAYLHHPSYHAKLVIEKYSWPDLMPFFDYRVTEEQRNLTFDAILLYGTCAFGLVERLRDSVKDDGVRHTCDLHQQGLAKLAIALGHLEVLLYLLDRDTGLALRADSLLLTSISCGNSGAAKVVLNHRQHLGNELTEQEILNVTLATSLLSRAVQQL